MQLNALTPRQDISVSIAEAQDKNDGTEAEISLRQAFPQLQL